MGGFASIVRGALAGVNDAAGNHETAQALEQRNAEARKAKQDEMRAKVLPHALAIRGLQERLKTTDDPAERAALTHDLTRNLEEISDTLYPDRNPKGNFFERGLTDKLHLTSLKSRQDKLKAQQEGKKQQAEEGGKAIAEGAPAPVNPYKQEMSQLAGVGFTPEEQKKAIASKVGLAPKVETDKELFIQDYMDRNKGKTREDAERAYTDATTKDTSAAKPDAPLEAGGIPYGVRAGGQEYLAAQLGPNGDAPPQAKQIWGTIQAGIKAKKDEAEAKDEERQNRFLQGLAAVAARQGKSEQFQVQMADYREQLGVYKTLDQQADKTQVLADTYDAQYAQKGNHSATDTALLTDYTSVLAQGGRKTQAEINMARQIGSFELNWKQRGQKFLTGELPAELRKMYLDYIHMAAKTQREDADKAKPRLPALVGSALADTETPPSGQEDAPPASMLKEGVKTTFKDGSAWTLENGKQKRLN